MIGSSRDGDNVRPVGHIALTAVSPNSGILCRNDSTVGFQPDCVFESGRYGDNIRPVGHITLTAVIITHNNGHIVQIHNNARTICNDSAVGFQPDCVIASSRDGIKHSGFLLGGNTFFGAVLVISCHNVLCCCFSVLSGSIKFLRRLILICGYNHLCYDQNRRDYQHSRSTGDSSYFYPLFLRLLPLLLCDGAALLGLLLAVLVAAKSIKHLGGSRVFIRVCGFAAHFNDGFVVGLTFIFSICPQ